MGSGASLGHGVGACMSTSPDGACTQVSAPSHVSNIPSGVPGTSPPPNENTSSFSDHTQRISKPWLQDAKASSSARMLYGSEFKLSVAIVFPPPAMS